MLFDRVGHGGCVRGGLTHYIDQYGRLSVGADDRVARLEAGLDRGHVGEQHRNVVHRGHHDPSQIIRRRGSSADERQLEVMVFIDQAGRLDHIRVLQRVDNLRYGQAPPVETAGIDKDVIFADLTTLNRHRGHTGGARQRRADGELGDRAKRSGIALRRGD